MSKYTNVNKNIVVQSVGRMGTHYIKDLFLINNNNLTEYHSDGTPLFELSVARLPFHEWAKDRHYTLTTLNNVSSEEGKNWITKFWGRPDWTFFNRPDILKVFLYRQNLSAMLRSGLIAAELDEFVYRKDLQYNIPKTLEITDQQMHVTYTHLFSQIIELIITHCNEVINLGYESDVLIYEDVKANPSKYFKFTDTNHLPVPYPNSAYHTDLYEKCKNYIPQSIVDSLNTLIQPLNLGIEFHK